MGCAVGAVAKVVACGVRGRLGAPRRRGVGRRTCLVALAFGTGRAGEVAVLTAQVMPAGVSASSRLAPCVSGSTCTVGPTLTCRPLAEGSGTSRDACRTTCGRQGVVVVVGSRATLCLPVCAVFGSIGTGVRSV